MEYLYYTFYTLQEVLETADKMNKYWGFSTDPKKSSTYFDLNSFFYDENTQTWKIIKDKWSSFLYP